MEMVQTVAQPQELAFIMPGMIVAGATTAAPADPSVFAALLQDMLSPVPAGAGVEIQGGASPAGTAPGSSLVKGRLNPRSATVPDETVTVSAEEQSDPGGAQLAQLLAAAAQAAGLQSLPQPDSKPVTVSEQTEGDGAPGKVTGVPVPPVLPQFVVAGIQAEAGQKEGAILTALPEPHRLQGLTAAPQMASEQACRMLSEGAETKAPAAFLSREDAGGREIAGDTAKTAISPESGNSADVTSSLPQTRQPLGKDALPEGPTGAAAHPATEPALPGQNALPSGRGEAFSGAAQAQAMSAPSVPFTPENLADAARAGKTQGHAVGAQATRPLATADQALFAGPMLSASGGKEALSPQSAVTAAGNASEVAFVAPFSKSWGSDRGGNGAEEKGKENLPNSGVMPPHTLGLTEPGRAAFQPKVDEAKNLMHESILAQVREGVVHHDGKGNGRMTLRLNPLELGELQINVRVEAKQVKVEILSDNRTVREALVGNLDALKETLQKQNLNMEGFAVSTGGGNGFSQPFREERSDQRNSSRIPLSRDSGPPDVLPVKTEAVWGSEESSLVDLRL